MKTFRSIFTLIAVVFLSSSFVNAQTAKIQLIHNSADVISENVDIYVNGEMFIDDFKFRTATRFIEVPGNTPLNIEIVPQPDNIDIIETKWQQTYTLKGGETYILVANGLLSEDRYSSFEPFDIYPFAGAREEAMQSPNGAMTDVLVFHGSTDAPTVDVWESAVVDGEVINDLDYGKFAGYLSLPTDDYTLQVRDESGSNVIAQYAAPLQTLGLEGAAISVFASGFISPIDGDPSFGLFAATARGGDLVELPVVVKTDDPGVDGTAKVQIIHNSADVISQNVDIYVNGEMFIDDLMFREATRFIEVPAGVDLNVQVYPQSDDFDINEKITWSQTYNLKNGETYILIANGLISEARYSTFKPFDIYPFAGAREEAIPSPTSPTTDVLVFHGSTDAPTVDIFESDVVNGEVINDLEYGSYAGYLSLPTNNYTLQVRDESGSDVVAQYAAPLQLLGLEGAAISVIASGFLSPSDGDPGFGLYAALPTGGMMIPLPVVRNTATAVESSAVVQIIHNSADMIAESVDIWVNGKLYANDLGFRQATPFVAVPANEDIKVEIIASAMGNIEPKEWSTMFNLKAGERYMVIASGLISNEGYEPFQAFDLSVFQGAREKAVQNNGTSTTDVIVYHGSTDAPEVDIVEVAIGAGTIIDDLKYGEFSGYLSLPVADYSLQVQNKDGTDVVAQYAAPLRTLGLEGTALAVIASGFLNPANNNNGPSFGLFAALPLGGDLIELPAEQISQVAETARVQVIHNSADAAAAVVDVWLNDALLLDDFAFRTASPFVDAPAGEEFTIAIQSPDSQSPENPIWSQNYTLAEGETYILVADGIVSASGYDPNQPFDIAVYDMGREMASMMENTDVLVHHGSTDAPTVDVYETGVGAGEIIDDLMYADFAGYLELGTMDYVLEVRDETGMNRVAAYSAPLETLELNGAAITVVASGFLTPDNNSNGPAFGLWVALASGGELVELPAYVAPTARVQVIHNSADAAAEVVDVWLNDALLLDDFAFRTASPFVDAPAGEEFTIAIQGPDSQSPENPIWSQNYTLEDGETYILVADGIVSASGYEPNQPFDIAVYAMGREMASMMENTDVLVHHGSTDAPTVDVYETGVGAGEIVNDLMYADFAGYLELGTLDYVLEVRDETGMNTVAAYSAPLATLGLNGAAITVVASGFLTPDNNSNGPAFGLWVALASGGELVELPAYVAPTARVQVIHNSADAAAAVVDVWLNDALLLDNFAFRTASPFVDAPAGEEFTIAIQGPDSQSPENPIWSQNYTLAEGETYILVADGIVSASGYDPNQPFDIAVYAMGREMASMMDNTDVLVHHGSTDAPTVDIYETGVGAGEIVNDLMYMDFAGYLELATANYSLQIRDETGETAVATFAAPLDDLMLDGEAITVVASGFLNPDNNSNGPAFGLWVALAAGGELVQLTNTSGVEDIIDVTSLNVFPNPAINTVNIDFIVKQDDRVTLEVMNILGSTMISKEISNLSRNSAHRESVNVSDLPEGIYIMSISSSESAVTRKIQVIK